MSKLVTIFGGSGFVGRYIARRMARDGWRVRVAVRRPNEALFVKPYGVVGQVEPVFANVRDDASVAAAMAGSDAVVNCVGILAPSGKNSFGAVQDEGAGRVARIAAEQGIERFVHLSAIGSDADSSSEYAQTKAAGEAAVMAALPSAVILRPSIIFGPEDLFFNRFAGMARFGLFLPIAGAQTRFQPVYVDDVARAAVKALTEGCEAGIYELGGPEIKTFREMMQDMLDVVQRRRVIIGLPMFAAYPMAFGFDLAQKISLGLFTNGILTRDQLKNLQNDNVVSDDSRGLADLGVDPTPYEAVLPDYLWPYRVSGQYAEIKASAKNLKM